VPASCTAVVGKVCCCTAIEALVDQHHQLVEDYMLADWQPVERLQDWHDVAVCHSRHIPSANCAAAFWTTNAVDVGR